MFHIRCLCVLLVIVNVGGSVSAQTFDALTSNIGYGKTLTWRSSSEFPNREFEWANRGGTSYGGRDLLSLRRKHSTSYHELVTFGTDGSFGIRNSSPNPAYALDVNGQIKVRNNIHIEGGDFGRSTTFGNNNDYWEIKHGLGMNGVPTIRFKDGRIGITGNGTFPSDWHTSADLEVFNDGWPMFSIGTNMAATKSAVTMAIATSGDIWYNSLTQKGDFMIFSQGTEVKNFIIAAPKASQGVIRFTTSPDGVTDHERLHISKDGRVGIGVSNPTSFMLDINGSTRVRGTELVLGSHDGRYQGATNANRALVHTGGSSEDFLVINYNNDFESGTIIESGVGIATRNIPAGFKLAVKEGIYTEQIKVATYANWPDYVFSEGYSLKTLDEVENFVKGHGHLPDVPSARDVEENGLELTQMNAILLRKIEELTLYLIEQDKDVGQLKNEFKNMSSQLEELFEKVESDIGIGGE